MKLSVSTKIFLGFAVVIVAFGSTCAYTLYQMSSQRRSVTVIWKEVIPVSEKLEALSAKLESAEDFLALKRPSDLEWLQRALPRIDPFGGPLGIESAIGRVEALSNNDALAEVDQSSLRQVAVRLRKFSDGRALADATAGEALGDLVNVRDPLPSDVFYDRLIRRALKRASADQLTESSPETRATVRVLRRLHREVGDAIRGLAGPTRDIELRAESDERTTTLAVVIIASGALVLSLIMLAISQLTLAPIRQLKEGAQRIAAGDYSEKVVIKSGDEIGQLGTEFNRMAASLQARDAEVARQREELLRSERLATIGKLAAQITHEVRNPLSSIGLNAELLEDELANLPDGEDIRASLKAIMSEVQRLKSITEDYLHFARLPQPKRAMVDVGALLAQFLSFLSHEVADAGIELVADGIAPSLEGGPPPIRADADQLRQAFLNIARNAIDALRGSAEPRRLGVTLGPLSGGGVTIRIADNGPGIDDELRARIFEPFVTGKSHGTGLGLALTREIIVEHGGTIQAESPAMAGRGTAFTVTLPVTGSAGPVVDGRLPGYS